MLPQPLQPISPQPVDVDARLPVDCIRPVRSDRHVSPPRVSMVFNKSYACSVALTRVSRAGGCERRELRAAAWGRRQQGRFPLRATTTVADPPRDARAAQTCEEGT